MIDVFIRTTNAEAADPMRFAMLAAVRARWAKEPVHVFMVKNLGIREGRRYAEGLAVSDPYIFTDSDVLIVGTDWVKRGTEAMLANPEFKVCSSLSLVEGENLAKPPVNWVKTGMLGISDVFTQGPQPAIYEMHAVGAPMWIRKGILTDLPELTLDQECGQIHKLVLDKGFKEGLINGLRHNHLGHGFSSNPALHWGF